MSTKYKIRDQTSLYFITFAVVNWVDVFTRQQYRDISYDYGFGLNVLSLLDEGSETEANIKTQVNIGENENPVYPLGL